MIRAPENVEAYPLCWPAGWPRTEPGKRQHARFFGTAIVQYSTGVSYQRKRSKTIAEARDFLRLELDRLGARGVTISTNVRTRRDGEISGSASSTPVDPGVAVYFTLKGHSRCFPCDRWFTVADNLWAIAKSIEAMRGLERWGAERMVDAAFTGFRALPENASPSDWRSVLELDDVDSVTPEEVRTAYRRLAHIRHPDKGGSDGAFRELVAALEVAMREVGG